MFDGCICIAVIHHLSTSTRRADAIKELARIVKTTGRILIYVWALEQELDDQRCENTPSCDSTTNEETVFKNNPSLCSSDKEAGENRNCIQVCEGRTKFQQQDLLIPWHLKSNKAKTVDGTENEADKETVFHRFYHVFKDNELRELCLQIENVTIEEIYLDRGNWCAILRKL